MWSLRSAGIFIGQRLSSAGHAAYKLSTDILRWLRLIHDSVCFRFLPLMLKNNFIFRTRQALRTPNAGLGFRCIGTSSHFSPDSHYRATKCTVPEVIWINVFCLFCLVSSWEEDGLCGDSIHSGNWRSMESEPWIPGHCLLFFFFSLMEYKRQYF